MSPPARRPHDSARAVSHSEFWRQWVHIAFGAGALLLRYFHWWQAAAFLAVAICVNIWVLRRLFRGRLHRAHELTHAFPPGLVLYPTSILLLVLMLPSRLDIVAAAWGILAFGDGAATIVGIRFGNRKWPWNRQKSVAGSVAFVVAGGVAGAFLAWWCRPAIVPPPYLWFSIAAPFVAALGAAAVETVAIRLDDNLSVSLTSAALLWALSLVNEELALAAAAAAPAALAVAAPANALVAFIGHRARTLSTSGAIVGAIIGTIIFVSAGWQGWLLLIAAFGFAAGASWMGLERKTLLGIAEERGGRRGAGNAIANTGIAAIATVLADVSYGHVAGLVAFTAALTAGASDTVASEIGKAWGRRTFALFPPKPVPPGTPGAVSLEGTAAGLVGAAALASIAIALGLIPAQALAAVIVGATVASLIESLLAATFEGPGILNNDALNMVNTAVAAFVAVSMAGIGP